MTKQKKMVLNKSRPSRIDMIDVLKLFGNVSVTSRARGNIPADTYRFSLDESQAAELLKSVAEGKKEFEVLNLNKLKPEMIKITVETSL